MHKKDRERLKLARAILANAPVLLTGKELGDKLVKETGKRGHSTTLTPLIKAEARRRGIKYKGRARRTADERSNLGALEDANAQNLVVKHKPNNGDAATRAMLGAFVRQWPNLRSLSVIVHDDGTFTCECKTREVVEHTAVFDNV